MVEGFVDYALGPHGRFLSDLYLHYQFPINTLIVGITIYKLFQGRKKKAAETT